MRYTWQSLCCRVLDRRLFTARSWSPLKVLQEDGLKAFRDEAFAPSLPIVLPRGAFLRLPAVLKWFILLKDDTSISCLNQSYLKKFGDTIVPLEYSRSAPISNPEDVETSFQQAQVPLQMFLEWAEHATIDSPDRLYLAQASFHSLPMELTDDLPTPSMVAKVGKGDIYDRNLWIGFPPTYTPLHRDPNPNLFVQLAGQKVVRLLPPDVGWDVFATVQAALGRSMSATFRGEEMMKGKEKALLEAQIWDNAIEYKDGRVSGYEACLGPGDGVFIPKGWWHSVKGIGNGITGSVSEAY